MRNSAFALFLSLFLFAGSAGAVERKAVDFSLSNWDGAKVSLGDLKGKTAILTFSYANCSIRCPIITGRLSSLDASMGAPGDVVYLHISVDPGADTAERRRKYFSLYGIDASRDNRWLFLSGKEKQLPGIWKAYGVTARKVRDRKLPEGYYIDYFQKVLVVDKEGFVRFEGGPDFSEDEVRNIIGNLSAKPSIRFSETSFDFGFVKEGDIVSHDFEFTNEGTGKLVIKDLIPA